MYMGFMKRGLSLMTCFLLITFASSWLNIGPLLFIGIIVWFYSFFDTLNLRSTPDDEFYELEDNYIIFPDFLESFSHIKFQGKYRNIFAVVLIIIGFTILWDNFLSIFQGLIPAYLQDALYSFGNYLPQLVIGIAIIMFGVYLIKGKKQELDDEEVDANEAKNQVLDDDEFNDNKAENKE